MSATGSGLIGKLVGKIGSKAGGAFAGAAPNIAGKLGEQAVRAIANVGEKVLVKLKDGTKIIPDGITRKIVTEIKNVKYQSYTKQLKNYVKFAKETGRKVELWMRRGSKVSDTILKEKAITVRWYNLP